MVLPRRNTRRQRFPRAGGVRVAEEILAGEEFAAAAVGSIGLDERVDVQVQRVRSALGVAGRIDAAVHADEARPRASNGRWRRRRKGRSARGMSDVRTGQAQFAGPSDGAGSVPRVIIMFARGAPGGAAFSDGRFVSVAAGSSSKSGVQPSSSNQRPPTSRLTGNA
jgi:hypothetical protein